MTELTQARRNTLRVLVDTVAPAVTEPNDSTGFWATPGSATGAHDALAEWLETGLPPEVSAGLCQVLDTLARLGFDDEQAQESREELLHGLAATDRETRINLTTLVDNAKGKIYACTDEDGRNPFWAGIGYPGPQAFPRPDAEEIIIPYVPQDGEILNCDVVVVGSGAGGGTIAGVLASAGKSVVVLEDGGAHSERHFRQLELWAHENLYYRGGPAATADGNVVMYAGATLGGGTTINWQNWVAPSDQVRAEWAEHGLADVATEEFDRHLAAVSARVGANGDCSDRNGPHQRLVAGADKLGWSWRPAVRNSDPSCYDPALAGYAHFGDLTGSKQSTLKTYLVDAHTGGAKILTRTHADRIEVADGRARAVHATHTDQETGRTGQVTVNATDIVVACGALETPALLLRSGIGGPAVGKNLRLHPATMVFGEYTDDLRGWWGPPQAAIVDEFREQDGNGWIIENSHFYPGTWALQLAWNRGREHKELVSRLSRMALWLFIIRDRGSGEVVLDQTGQPLHYYPMSDELDQRHFKDGMASLIRLHEAAGAERIHYSVMGMGHWERGQDIDAWIAKLRELPFGAGGLPAGSAHQMGTARMGVDPSTSACTPRGELHDVRGIWIGDTSAFPTPSGANPMFTCMALAHRTAENLLAVQS